MQRKNQSRTATRSETVGHTTDGLGPVSFLLRGGFEFHSVMATAGWLLARTWCLHSLALLLHLQVRGDKTCQLQSIQVRNSLFWQSIEILWTCFNLPSVKKMPLWWKDVPEKPRWFHRLESCGSKQLSCFYKQHVDVTDKYQFFSNFLNFMIFSLKFGSFYYW